MTGRKFTPPTEFPAEYVDGTGDTITLRCKGIGEYPYIGQNGDGYWEAYTEDGSLLTDGSRSKNDLHDIPPKQVHWTNDYNGYQAKPWWASRGDADVSALPNRIAVIRREWVEGELPQYFVEEV